MMCYRIPAFAGMTEEREGLNDEDEGGRNDGGGEGLRQG